MLIAAPGAVMLLAFLLLVAALGRSSSVTCGSQMQVERRASAAVPLRFCYKTYDCGPLTVLSPVGGAGTKLSTTLVWSVLVGPDDHQLTFTWRGCGTLNQVVLRQTLYAVGFVVSVSDCALPASPPAEDHWYQTSVMLRAPLGNRTISNDGPASICGD
jgi:hypothetical protein